MSFQFICKDNNYNFNNNKLIISAVSIGNVAQLATDIYIYNYKLKRVGYIYDSAVIPIVGNDPFIRKLKVSKCKGVIHLGVEVFQNNEHNLTFIQCRSDTVKYRRYEFVVRLMKWIEECKFKDVIVLSSVASSLQSDIHLSHIPFGYFVSKYYNSNDSLPSCLRLPECDDDNENIKYKLGGGLSRLLHRQCDEYKIPLLGIVAFVHEGDNTQHGLTMAQILDDHINHNEKLDKWKIPPIIDLAFGGNNSLHLTHYAL